MKGKPAWAVRMREQRIGNGMTVEDLAARSKVSHGTIERMEKGIGPNLRSIEKVAKALKFTLSQFFAE